MFLAASISPSLAVGRASTTWWQTTTATRMTMNVTLFFIMVNVMEE
jgi:hypothetical protein